jgi:membrane fusion protein (multidrug efflux system)
VLLAVALLVVALVALNAFKSHMMQQYLRAGAGVPQAVTTGIAVLSEWQPEIAAVGSLRAVQGVDITTETAGLVRQLRFRSGAHAAAGEVLLELNADADRAQLEALSAAADLAATTLQRDELQYEARAISKAQLDADRAQLRNSRALVAAQAAAVAKKTLRAPFAGRLGITTVNPGQYLNPGDKVVTLQSIDPIYLDFQLPQRHLSEISVGQLVTVVTDAHPGRSFSGRISALDARVDPASRNFAVQATLENHDGTLVPGTFAHAAIATGTTQRYVTIPQTAVSYEPYGASVFVARRAQGGSALQVQKSFVTLGPTRGDQVAVLAGLNSGEQIVTSGQLKLRNGSPIVVDNRVVPTNDANPKPQED